MTYPPLAVHRGAPSAPGPRTRRILLGVAAAAFIALVAVPWLASFATDWLWFREIHFESVFLTSLAARGLLFVGRWRIRIRVPVCESQVGAPQSHRRPHILRASRGRGHERGSHVAGSQAPGSPPRSSSPLSSVSSASAQWMTVLMAIRGVPVGDTDPVLGRDIGFYLFQLPAISAALGTLVVLTTLSLAAVVLLYVMRGAIVLRRRASVEPAAARHVGALLVSLLLLFAAQLWIVDAAALLYSNTGPLAGASYADVHVSLPGIRLSAAAALLAAGLVVYGVLRQKLVWFAALAVATFAGVSVVFRGLIPLAEQKFVVAPNELARERTYLQQHIAATRRAWQLDSVATRDLGGDVQLTMADIRANAPTIDNVRLWERDLLKQTFGQLQEIRTYYDFASVSDDRYMIDGHYRQVHVSARELNTASLPTRNFINERLTFTHGMGIAMAPVNQVTAEGLPVLFIKDLPPVSTVSVKVTRPQIYYGELTNSYVFVGTGSERVRLPRRRDERLHELHRSRRRSDRVIPAARALRLGARFDGHPAVVVHLARRAHHVPPQHRRASQDRPAISGFRRRAVSGGDRFRHAEVDARCVHVEPQLAVLAAGGGRNELHAQQREGRDRRL